MLTDIKKAIYVITKVTEIPVTQRSAQDKNQLDEAQRLVDTNFEEFFKALTKDFNEEVLEESQSPTFLGYVKTMSLVKTPTIPKTVTLEDISDLNIQWL